MAFESGDIAAAFLVFPRGSPLALDISEAILKVTESTEIEQLEDYMFSSFKCSSSTDMSDWPGIRRLSFCVWQKGIEKCKFLTS
ncbi:hypothetical protein CUMW_045020 [Citrus unshiu]|nr:hypothetical protein CUMW_045020 [Citrus unshiu]